MNSKFDLIPKDAIEAIADRFELGQRNYKEEAWNANANKHKLDDKAWIGERIVHGRQHLNHFLSVMNGILKDDGDDDGAAIMWLGCMLHEAWIRRKEKEKENES